MMEDKVSENPVVLRATVFCYRRKTADGVQTLQWQNM